MMLWNKKISMEWETETEVYNTVKPEVRGKQ